MVSGHLSQGMEEPKQVGAFIDSQSHFLVPLEYSEWDPFALLTNISKVLEQFTGNIVSTQQMFVEWRTDQTASFLYVRILLEIFHQRRKCIQVRTGVSLNVAQCDMSTKTGCGNTVPTKVISRCPLPQISKHCRASSFAESLPSDFPGILPSFVPGDSWWRDDLKLRLSGREVVIKNIFSLGICF